MRLSANLIWAWAVAACALLAAAPALAVRSDWNDGEGPGFGGPAARDGGGSMNANDRQTAMVAAASRNQVDRQRSARCGCDSTDPGNGQQAKAGL